MPKVPLDESMRVPRPQLPPNPELLRKDPMAEMFGPGSGVKVFGNPEDDIPDEIRCLLESNGLGKKTFQCMLKEIPAGTSVGERGTTVNTVYIKGFTRGIPSPDYIAKTYGPGDYLLCFTWSNTEDDGSHKNRHEELPISISEKVLGDFKRQRLNDKIKDASEIGSKVRDALVEKSLEGEMLKALTGKNTPEAVDQATAAKSYIQETIETAKMIGLSPYAAQPPARTFEWDKLLPAVITGITAFMQIQQNADQRRSEEFNKMLMLLMSSSQNSNNQLLEVMKVQSGAGSGNMAIREFKDMVLGALDIKDALSGNSKESLGDKIFRLVESVAPSILSIAATTAQSAQAAAANPMVQMAKGYIEKNPDFQALKKDPVEQKKTIDQMDRVYGWVQTDHILNTMGWQRPENCPRVAEYKDPAPDDADVSEGISGGEQEHLET